ncbi:MAG: Ig-like domain-containing protein [Tannerella sp.]|jgi:uncharacterized lipoprotein YajG|nr:Ig-like domain-containing protein [Tannerella sp.]
MKTKLLTIGYLIASLYLTGCNNDDEVTVKNISITPATVSAMETGATVELTASITPADATEAIRWVSYDPKIVSVEGTGTTALLTAVASGTTRIFATNKTGIVVSEEIAVKVNSSEYAGFVVGNYSGTAQLSGALNANLSGVKVTLSRVGNEPATVKLTVVATLPGMGAQEITSDAVNVSPGEEPETYALSGTASLPALGLLLNVSGMFRTADQSLALNLTAEGVITINIAATPETETSYSALAAGDYMGTAQLTGAVNETISDVPVTLEPIDGQTDKVTFKIVATLTGFGEMTITSDELSITPGETENEYALNGEAFIPMLGATLKITGAYRDANHTLSIILEAEGLVTIAYNGAK